MKTYHRAAMVFAVTVLFFMIIVSSLRGCTMVNHNCICADDGQDCICELCPSCLPITVRENLQKSLDFTFAAVVCIIANLFVFEIVRHISPGDKTAAYDTPISLRVKLLN